MMVNNKDRASNLPQMSQYEVTMLTHLKTFFRKLFFNYAYLGNPPWDTGISPPELLEYLESHPPGQALDLGCGTGTNVITMARAGWQVTGVDFVGRAIRIARRKVKAAGLAASFKIGDVTQLEGVEGPFDLVLDIGCLHSISPERRSAYFQNLERVLAHTGDYLLYAFWQDPENDSATGLSTMDIAALQKFMKLVQRTDGTERGRRPSTWFYFQKSLR
jgi:ubiquinone/menaquinone biosynthesis C-methylase UbiE